MNIQIEIMTTGDCNKAVDFIRRCGKDAFPDKKLPLGLSESIGPQIKNYLMYGNCIKVNANNEIIGAIISGRLEGGISTIIWLLVDPRFRGMGIGTQLMKFFIELEKKIGAHKIKLTVATENAKKFYLLSGFMQEGYHQNHWYQKNYWSMAYFINQEPFRVCKEQVSNSGNLDHSYD
jgi:ribosomal protein S18 acetylase RimI-like enzyme